MKVPISQVFDTDQEIQTVLMVIEKTDVARLMLRTERIGEALVILKIYTPKVKQE
jgi:hypothetical protein